MTLLADLGLSARRLAATPLFLLFAALSLGIGVAVPTTVYSILYELMWRPASVVRPHEAVLVTAGGGRWVGAMSLPDFDDFAARQRSLAPIAAFTQLAQSLVGTSVSEVVDIEAVSGGYFDVAGVPPLLGRTLDARDHDAALQVVVLSEPVWRTRYAAEPAVIGQAVRIGGAPFEVVGVMPASFRGVSAGGPARVDVWIPLTSVASTTGPAARSLDRNQRPLSIVGRLAPGRTVANVALEAQTVGASLDKEAPLTVFAGADRPRRPAPRLWSAKPLTDRDALPGLRVDLLLLAMTFLVLVVACTNLGNLLLSRGAARTHEFAVRRALGASRPRLVRELLGESVLIALCGAAVTYPLTAGLMWLVTMEVPTARGAVTVAPELSLPPMLVAGGALLASVLIFGLEPALSLTRDGSSVQLSSEAGAAPPRRRRRQRAFIRWQVAVAVSFFLVTTVLARLLIAEARHDSGIALDRLAVASVHFGLQGWDEPRARAALDRVGELTPEYPHLESVAIASGLPFGMSMTPMAQLSTPDRRFVLNGKYETSDVLTATPNIFRTLGVPVVAGRAFDDRDTPAAPLVGVISEFTALKMFGTRNAIGRQLSYKLYYGGYDAPQTITVVGISRDTDVDRLMSRDECLIYVPLAQRYLPNLLLIARTSGSASDAAATLQTIARRVDPELSTGTTGPASWLAAGPWVAARAGGAVATGLGLLTLALAMVGLYGVQSQLATHRTREVGIRMALGAAAASVQRMMIRDGFRPVLEGFAAGLVLGTLARGALRATIVGDVALVDPLALVVVPIPLALAAFAACYAPARRAARVDPSIALRHE